eukprot:CAMPEP_0196208576 /NCGR_PEP_ID=MMETSP0912-20130531/9125_1 /TAXON_ID=49265 /ORGANISM="Thalassiosira rotula, Strain GSO102" /LENGTH=152 /DNA_ID=CAMNT_0041483391 /DNA_START=117 /DNA_END=575 /DNA_ORIENTATION=+
MGKRAKKAPVQTGRKQTLAKRFKCPFCANEDVVECKMDLSKGVGSLACRVCSASYQMPIHHLHEPIDVFSEWLDDCEAAERGEVAAASSSSSKNRREDEVHDTGRDHYSGDEEEEEDDLPAASGLKRRGAEGGRKGGQTDLGLDDSEEEDSD